MSKRKKLINALGDIGLRDLKGRENDLARDLLDLLLENEASAPSQEAKTRKPRTVKTPLEKEIATGSAFTSKGNKKEAETPKKTETEKEIKENIQNLGKPTSKPLKAQPKEMPDPEPEDTLNEALDGPGDDTDDELPPHLR